MRPNLYFLFSGLISLLAFTACKQSHQILSGASTDPAYLEEQVTELFTQKCASCHSPGSGVSSFVEDILDFEALEELEYVIPGDAGGSYLYLLVNDPSSPHQEVSLSNDEVGLISDWITALGSSSGGGTSAYTFTQLDAQIIQPLCISCHNAGRSDGGVNLQGYSEVIKHINTSTPGSSLLYTEVQSESMPQGGLRKLSAAEKQKILLWIEQGALNN